jgi:catechol 2,3-dioxygenase-like lactoylglutathione lyase family enzyme
MSTFFKRIDTVFLKVNNFEKAIDWYCSVLGFTVRWKDENGGYAALNIGETPLTLVRTSGEELTLNKANVSFNFFTSDVEAAHQHLLENGVKAEQINVDGEVKWFKFEDLEGNQLEVCHFKE